MSQHRDMFFFCRSDFEKELVMELYGLFQMNRITADFIYENGCGYVVAHIHGDDANRDLSFLSCRNLIFARQVLGNGALLTDLPDTRRTEPVLSALKSIYASSEPLYKNLFISHPDTQQGKELAKFCKKFETPMQNGLKRLGLKKVFSRDDIPSIHIVFLDYKTAYIGLSFPDCSSEFFDGIMRLKFPKDAPSRSTLKLEEAFHYFLPKEKYREYFRPTFQAVDLGAAPGGWTYQFVKEGVFVNAVDHGAMHPSLMKSGLVAHLEEDAFNFQPIKGIDWLVCDIVDKPSRVTKMLVKWIKKRECKWIICNLKLPMKKRYEELVKCLHQIVSEGRIDSSQLLCKHLYHDREEVTLFVNLSK
ncbi:MAG: 23S rRNA (cytidine(2498)-2'-O)-methyltransferase RlmM [Oligoflexales bacterium]|nr:23S rRNA (cytidine(2498)-2'-O)-methyltransferase RlmM [Oligoflexales bacterium]